MGAATKEGMLLDTIPEWLSLLKQNNELSTMLRVLYLKVGLPTKINQ